MCEIKHIGIAYQGPSKLYVIADLKSELMFWQNNVIFESLLFNYVSK